VRRLQARPFIAALVAPLVLAGTAGCSKKQAAGGFQMPPMPVEVTVAERQAVADRFEALGTIEAADAVTVVSEINASVVSLPFKEGQAIGRGDLIAQLDDDQLSAEFARAEAVRNQRRSSHERVKEVVDQGAGAAQDLDDSRAALEVAEAELALAKARLAKTRIVAPFSGVIGARRVSPGAFLRAGDPITELARIDELRVNFAAPEKYLGVLHRGAEVSVSTTADTGGVLTGRVDVVDPVLDPVTRTARIVARVPNPGLRLLPGMSANITAILTERANAITVPNEAIFVEGDRTYVYVVNPDSTVARNALVLGTRLAGVVEVVEGLKEGARVVRAGHQKLFDGAKVMPVPHAEGSPAGEPAADTAEVR